MKKNKFSKIESIINVAKKGGMYILVDDENRENEGDIVFCASDVDAKKINFMAKYGRGLICLTLNHNQAKKLDLNYMSPVNQSRNQTAFTVSIEAKKGVTTGISAQDRAKTIKVAINGFGRIGRNIFRAVYESKREDQFQIVAVNDLGDASTNAHLLEYDTAHGKFNQAVTIEDDHFVVGKSRVRVLAERNPTQLPWSQLDVDVVMECTGLWFAGGKFGIGWKLVQAAVRAPVTIKGFCLLEDSDDDEAVAVLDAAE